MPEHAHELVRILHTHFDPEWYRLHGAFLPRLVALVDRVLDLLEREPDVGAFHLDGQTVLLEDYLSVRPDARDRVARLVACGRLAVGPWYVLADEVLSSGEALITNLAYGTRDAVALGRRLDVGYSPDAFGHPAELPQVLAGFGIETAIVWRGVPEGMGDRFRWVGPDGSKVCVYHLPPWGYETAASVEDVVARARGYVVPLFEGADHHEPEPDVARRWGAPPAVRLDEALDTLSRDDLPEVVGELRAVGAQWLLSGVLSSRLSLKRAIHRTGRALEWWAEPLSALARDVAGASALGLAWRLHLRNHFHDTLCGTVSDDVARAALSRTGEVEAIAREVARASWDALVEHDAVAARRSDRDSWRPALVLWNPVPRARGTTVIAEVTRYTVDMPVGSVPYADVLEPEPPSVFHLEDQATGHPIPVQVLIRRPGVELLESPRDYPDQDEVEVVRVAFNAPAVPGWGVRTLRVVEGMAPLPETALEVTADRLANGHVIVEIAEDGTATIEDRATGERYPGLLALEDGPDHGDLYTYSPPAGAIPSQTAFGGERRVVADGPFVGAVEVGDSEFRATWLLRHDSPVVQVALHHYHTASDHRLRALVPTGLAGVDAVAGGAFGPTRRAARRSRGISAVGEVPPSTDPCQRIVAIARAQRGLAVFTDGLPEYEAQGNGTIALTLLRAVGALSRGALMARPGHAAWATPVPAAQEPGDHEWHVGFLAVGEDAVAAWTPVAEAADEFDLPLAARTIRNALDLRDCGGGVALEGDGLVATALRRAPGARAGIVLRCMNTLDEATRGIWRFASPIAAAYRERLDGTRSYPLAIAADGTVEIVAEPREIVTVRVTWAGP